MKPLCVLFMLLMSVRAHGYGVVVLDAESMQLLAPLEVGYDVHVDQQVAITHVGGSYINPTNGNLDPVWVFPLPAEASATRLRYRMNGSWTDVPIAAGSQNPGLPGDTVHPTLRAYMGTTPLVFHFEHALAPDSTLIVELDYVELLPYSFGTVSMRHPANLHAILPNHIISSAYHLELTYDNNLESLALTSGQLGEAVSYEGGVGTVDWSDPAGYPDEDFVVEYQLDQTQLGLFATSTTLPDSLMPAGEDGPSGFLMFLAQPDPDDQTVVMDKVFTLILDRSGSMAGEKMQQARAAASFIVGNLNEGDRFNLIAFNDYLYTFQPQHVPFNPQTAAEAQTWITQQTDTDRGTNMSAAFEIAVPQFASASDSTANIIIFLTDGIPHGGISDETQLVAYVDGLFQQLEAPVSLFCFGIGNDVNPSLLGQLAAHNLGFAEFLRDGELEDRISEFYRQVRNPVLMQPWVEAVPNVLVGMAPEPLPSLFIGRQLIVSARYTEAAPVQLTLHGNAFGQPVEYTYPLSLAEDYQESRAFLPKVWAKQTIESLMVEYYQLDPDSPEGLALEQQIVDLSLTWGVVCDLTSFNDDTALPETEPAPRPSSLLLVENSPNPFNPSTTLRITVPAGVRHGPLLVRVYDLRGALVRTLAIVVPGPGVYEIVWNGCDEAGRAVASGAYLILASCADHVTAHRVLLLK